MVWQKLVNCCTTRKQQIDCLLLKLVLYMFGPRVVDIDFNALEMCHCL